jgi:TonB-dependent SusC/RagA subfamily outer membrane receptor
MQGRFASPSDATCSLLHLRPRQGRAAQLGEHENEAEAGYVPKVENRPRRARPGRFCLRHPAASGVLTVTSLIGLFVKTRAALEAPMKHAWFAAVALLISQGVSDAQAQTRMIVGRVSDSTFNEPVTRGLVRVLGTPIQAQLRNDGTFVIYVPVREVTLSLEAPGYQEREIRVASHQETVVFAVRRDVFELSRVVVTGQGGGIERRNLPHAVSSVGSEDLSRVPAPSLDDALRGKVNGASISARSGAPGGGIQVRLRGVSTILGSVDPLFIVDGVMVSNATIPGGVNAITQGQRGVIASSQEDALNRLADINPNDIESVEILKGASAAAMYGSRASNGVVIITTKRGRFTREN